MKNKRRKLAAVLFTVMALVLIFAANGAAKELKPYPGPLVVYFSRGSVDLDQNSIERIRQFAGSLDKDAVQQVVVYGYSDSMSLSPARPYSGNRELSQTRADNVAALLQSESGLPPHIFTSIGRGIKNPVGDNATEEGRAANRRVEIRVSMGEAPEAALVEPAAQPEEAWLDESEVEPAAGVPVKIPAAEGPGAADRVDQWLEIEEEAAAYISMSLDDVEIAEAFEMISRRDRINIILDKSVSGTVSINLYDLTTEQAIYAIAESAGYAVRKKYNGYIILPEDIADGNQHDTTIRAFKVQYSSPEQVRGILEEHMSKHGKITVLADRSLIVIEDNLQSLERMEKLLAEIDKQPRQILIEAKILEIKLSDNESWGLNWAHFFSAGGGEASIGWRGDASSSFTGFVATVDRESLTAALNMLNEKGRVRTLSTPKLLALENQEASVIIGERQGYTVTTTINQVTTESVEFLESGVILNVTPSVDGQGRILMNIHPEVSTGSIDFGIPDKSTTEVTTMLLAEDGQPIFIGGLIRNSIDYQRNGIPILGDIPVLGRVFSDIEEKVGMTETVVLITPYLIKESGKTDILNNERDKVQKEEESIQERMKLLPEAMQSTTPLTDAWRHR
ncbi:MAG: OmpA family protein [Desulfobulbales bacterium]|nr:OmpA family protein [Desulfobulbales bacterium]